MMGVLVALLASPGVVELPGRTAGPVAARLWVEVPEEGAGPGRGRTRYTLALEGPAGLVLDGPRLEDALAAWRISGQAASWRQEGSVAVTITLDLVQVKPGPVPLPGVHLRVRESARGDWSDLSWPGPLHELRDVPPPVEVPAPDVPRWPAWVGSVAVAVVLAGSVLVYFRRRRRRGPGPVPAWQRARARLEEAQEMEVLAEELRDYLEEQLGLPASRLTTEELLRELVARGDVAPALLQGVRELLQQSDLVKFAGQPAASDQLAAARRRTIELIEALMGWPRPAGEGDGAGERRTSGEAR